MLGDCTLGSSHYSRGTPGSYEQIVGTDYSYPFELTRDFFLNDDFTIANLECALTDRTAHSGKTFPFRGSPASVNILLDGGIDFVSLGNNHSMDYGQGGYDDTKAILDSVGIGHAGRDEYSLYTTERGLTIGVYALSFGQTPQIQTGIAALKEAGAELIIAALHWGTEGFYRENATQRSQAAAAITAGADIIMGTHPHTLQPLSWIDGKPVFYSIGNWTFGGNSNPRDRDTVIARVIIKRIHTGQLTIEGIELIPCSISSSQNGNNYQPAPYAPESVEYNRVMRKLAGTFEGSNLVVNYSYGE
jgi:poly-gamma-glutamate synthesis protein (capsule biosynthesis protein)